ncbi:MAG: hypothetical protein VB912_11800, partial [Pirellulaceae bacterium]
SFGILGILANVLLDDYFELGTVIRVVISIVLSGGVSLVFARLVARTIWSWLPTLETHGIYGTDLGGPDSGSPVPGGSVPGGPDSGECIATVLAETKEEE